MSGSGKSTLTTHAKDKLERQGFTVLVLDGDAVRKEYDLQLGYNREDIQTNNLNIAKLCIQERCNYDVIFVPIISPIDKLRKKVKTLLSPNYHLIYLDCDIQSLRSRDPKGLYKRADSGEIDDLIGYSNNNPYDVPVDYDLIVDTSIRSDFNVTKSLFERFIFRNVFASTALL
jgi:adenylylsulfate kinase